MPLHHGISMTALSHRVKEAAILAGRSPSFQSFLHGAKPSKDDYILFNSTFLYRDVETRKSPKHVAVRVTGHPLDVDEVLVIDEFPAFTAQFKLVSRRSKNLVAVDLTSACDEQVVRFGRLAFVLIGTPAAAPHTEMVAHGTFKRLIWDETASEDLSIEPDGTGIRLRQIHDEAALWVKLNEVLADRGEAVEATFRDTLCQALNSIQDSAIAELALPSGSFVSKGGLTDRIAGSLQEQAKHYRSELKGLGSSTGHQAAQTEVYRLAYTFASDAFTYLQLLVSVCDLKPIVLWLALPAFLRLNEAFQALPWSDSRHKPSLKNYRTAIADARNSAFHNAFPFRHSLKVSLPDGAIEHPELTFFAPHGANRNQFSYQDKELVEVLLRFTRARERLLPRTFWENNADVMDRVVELFHAASSALILIHEEIGLRSKMDAGPDVHARGGRTSA